ncbi:MAG: hypothetical protein ACP5N1_04620 [Candidatus Woesearchaeota archaeon]
MKPIDEDKKIETIDKLIDDINKKDKYHVSIGPLEIEIPKKFFYTIMEKQCFWEATNIADVIDNYEKITQVVIPYTEEEEKDLKNRLEESLKKSLDSQNISGWSRLYKFYGGIISDLKAIKKVTKVIHQTELRLPSDKINNNIVFLDNVYLGDYKFRNSKSYDACDMIIKDNFGNQVAGVALYNQKIIKNVGTLEEELSVAMSHADYSTSFDITFSAIPRRVQKSSFSFGKNKIYDSKLNIHSIQKHTGMKEDLFPIDVGVVNTKYS